MYCLALKTYSETSLDCLQKFAMHAHALDARMDAVTIKTEMFILAALSYNNFQVT